MRRADLLPLINLSPGGFNALGSRSLLPFQGDGRRGGWGTYSADDALRFALLLDLGRIGLPQVEAAAIVRSYFDDLLDYADGCSTAPILFGTISTIIETTGEPGAKTSFPLIAAFGDLDAQATAVLDQVGQTEGQVSEISVVNATALLAGILAKARQRDHVDPRFDELGALFGLSS